MDSFGVSMENQILFNTAFSFIIFLLGWFVRIAYDATVKMKNDIVELERMLTGHYVRKEDYREDIKEIKEILMSINHKIDNKVDKQDPRLDK